MNQDKKITFREILENGMKEEVGWEYNSEMSNDIIAIKKPNKRFLEIIFKELDINILEKAITGLGDYLKKSDIDEIKDMGCAKCPFSRECKQVLISDKELRFCSAYQNAMGSFFGTPIIEFSGNVLRIYASGQGLKIIGEYKRFLKESKDEVRSIMLYGNVH